MGFNTDYWQGLRFTWGRVERALVISGGFVAVAVVALAIAAIDPATPDGGGESDHAGPVPSGVVRLAPDEYFIEDGARITPQEICLGGEEDVDGNLQSIEEAADVPGHGSVVECVSNQNWNAAREGDADLSYWEALVETAQKPLMLVLIGVCLGVSLLAWLAAVPDLVDWRRERRAFNLTNEQRVRELNRALARDPEFDANDYDEALRKLYRLGLKPAKD